MLVRSDGKTTLELSITSGGWDEQGDATVPVAVENWSVSTHLAGGCAPLIGIQVQSAISTLQNDLDRDNEISERAPCSCRC